MRKGIYAIVVAVYLLLSSGVVLQLHYCMDRLAEVGLFASDHQDACGDCGMEMNANNGCCQDRTDVIKLVQDQTFQAVSLSLPKLLVADCPVTYLNTNQVLATQPHFTPFSDDPPDPVFGRYRYRTLQVFRI